MHESTFHAQMTDLGDCPLCGRKLVTGSSVNQHHLVPRSRNGRDTIALHRICHAAIHAALSEKELERQYNTMERLREHPQLSRFIAWVRGKPPEFWVRTRRPR
jgi:5-methylcytosine-specific restriction endonuclease McrA